MKKLFLVLAALFFFHPLAQAEKPTLLFMGSSTVEFWKSLPKDFPEYRTVNKGKGGTEFTYLLENAKGWAAKIPAKAIVIYSGDNDIASGTSPDQIARNFREVVIGLHEAQPQARLFVISVKPSPSRQDKIPLVKKTNQLIQDECRRLGYVAYIDVFGAMLGKDGKPRREIFLEDMLHMKPAGYAIWKKIVSEALLQQEKQDRSGVEKEAV